MNSSAEAIEAEGEGGATSSSGLSCAGSLSSTGGGIVASDKDGDWRD